MYSRFLDNKVLIQKEGGFTKRTHGVHLHWLALAMIVAISIISLSIIYLQNIHPFILVGITVMSLLVLYFLVYYIIDKDRNIMYLLELQTALFAGSAKLATEFCIIMRYDGTVVYVDPKYNSKYFHLKNQGLSDFDALCESGGLNEETKKALLSALAEGRQGNIEFSVPVAQKESQTLSLTVDPIGIYHPQELSRKLNLAVHPLTRPSGYFFLRAKKNTIEEEYRECLDVFNLGYISIAEDNLILSCNNKFLDITGYEQSEIFSKQVDVLTIFSDKKSGTLISENNSFQGYASIKTKNDGIKKVLISQIITYTPPKATLRKHIIISPLQISNEVKINPNDVMNNLEIFEDSPLSSLILDDKGNIFKYNDAFKKFIQISEDKSLNILDLIEENKRNEVHDQLNMLSLGKVKIVKPIDVHFNINTSKNSNPENKEERIASLYLHAIDNNDPDSNNILIFSHLIDLTELKDMEFRFVHSQKMQAIGQLAGGIAHDFNNLLTAMIGFCDLLLLKHPPGDQSFPDIIQIKQNANRAANLVRQLLAFSRKQTLQPKIINITNALSDLSNLIRRLIGESINLKMIHGKDIGEVKVDHGQLEQVIINLAVNARDAMNNNGTLTIKTSNIKITDKNKYITEDMVTPTDEEYIEKGDYILIEVSDTGHGIKKDVINKIFDPFFSTKETGQGTGLGLSTVYGIIKQTNGYVYVSSKENIGTTFHILLKKINPLDENKNDLKQEKTNIKISEDENNKNENIDLTGRGNILLVEDEDPVRTFSTTALKQKGYKVLEADCAETAFKIMKQHGSTIDVIVTDVVMPGLNGPSMIKEIYKSYPNVKVIFVSGYGEDEFVKTYGNERSFNFLSKPYTLKQLALKVKEVSENKE